VRPSGVPHDVPHLVGREVELAWLDERLPAAESGRAVVICAVDGTAGVGKTALAVHWAHRVRDRFPDGNLYADLHGFGPGPAADPAAVLDGFFAMLDVAPGRIPADLPAKAALYRSLLDGRRMLVVLDNAASSEQVRPLLPASPGCLVLVTSRDSLTGLVARDRAQRLSLDVLPLPDAVALLAGFLGADRVAREGEAAAELAQLCARLPVALCVAGERAAPDEGTTVGDLTEQLRTAARRLDLLEAGGDASTEVRAVFSWSYAALPQDAARAFRLLGSSPVPQIDVHAVAALLGAEPDVAARHLHLLVRAHLARPAPGGRFGMHDLLREYAVERSHDEDGETERSTAIARLLDHYAHSAVVATELAFPGSRWTRPALGAPRAVVRSFPDDATARAWLDAERPNLVRATAYAADHGFPAEAVHLGIVLWLSLFIGAHHGEARIVHSAALRAARDIGDRAGEAVVLSGLGVLEIRVGRYEQARDAFERALAIFRDIGDRASEADTLGRLAGVYDAEARCEEGIALTRRALSIRRDLGDRLGEAYALHNIGLMLTTLQRHDEAVAALQQALGIFEEVGSAHLRGAGLGALAYAHRRSGRYEQALDCSLRCLELSEQVGNRAGQCEQYAELGLVHWRLGRHHEAVENLEESLRLARDTGSRPREAEALCLLGRVRHDLDPGAEVEELYQQALTIAREVGDDRLAASALNGLGEAYRAAGSPAEAFREHSAALLLARRVSDQEEVPRALEGVAHALDVQGGRAQAREHLEEALLLYTRLNLPEAARVRAELAQRFAHDPASAS
jgi:tetratricopeptide (TPR) repeat protein